MDKNNDAIEF